MAGGGGWERVWLGEETSEEAESGSSDGEVELGAGRCGACSGRAAQLWRAAECGHALCEACCRRCVVEQLGLMFRTELAAEAPEGGVEQRAASRAPRLRCPLLNCTAALPWPRARALLLRLAPPEAAAPVARPVYKVHVVRGGRAGSTELALEAGQETRLADLLGQARRRAVVALAESSSESLGSVPPPSPRLFSPLTPSQSGRLFADLSPLLAQNPKLRKLTIPNSTLVLDLSGRFNPALPLHQQLV